jgi:serine/threonine protein kinase
MGKDHASEMDDPFAEVLPILPSGTLLANRYRVEAILGQGAMGTVYEVERASDGRRFAAKVLNVKPDYRAMARFAREAQLLARLQHPNLISIVDVDITTDRLAYLIMELVHGKSLSELGARYGDREFMLPVLFQIADALTMVHSAGIVHRDLKPANVLISTSADGTEATAKLADFGISRLFDIEQEAPEAAPPARVEVIVEPLTAGPGTLDAALADPARAAAVSAQTAVSARNGFEATLDVRTRRAGIARPVDALRGAPPARPPAAPDGENRRGRRSEKLTPAGAVVGTLFYMAPEVYRGAHLAQPPADIFSFGIMAYEVLAGTMPFDRPPLLLARHGGELQCKPLDTMCRGLSQVLSRLLERCLAIDPASRPTAVELSAALGEI